MARRMDLESTLVLQGQLTKVNLGTNYFMDKGHSCGKMGGPIEVDGKRERCMDTECSYGLMVTNIKGNTFTARNRAKVLLSGGMERCLSESG